MEKRGRKPSKRFFIAVGIVNSKLVTETIECQTRTDAVLSFEEKYNQEPDQVLDGSGMGFYKVHTKNVKADKDTIPAPFEIIHNATTSVFRGEYKGWNFIGSGIKACEINGEVYEDNDLVKISILSRVDSASNTPKPKLRANTIIHRSALTLEM